MIDAASSPMATVSVDRLLQNRLARGDAMLDTVVPTINYLIAGSENGLFSDEIVASVRGMADHVVRQLLVDAVDGVNPEIDDGTTSELRSRLLGLDAFLIHCHALAIERILTERLNDTDAIDMLLTPMLQALTSSDDATTADLAKLVLSSQARFIQQQKRMELPVTELPGELFHKVLQFANMGVSIDREGHTLSACKKMRSSYDEGRSRFGMLARLVSSLDHGDRTALAIDHAGVAIFLSALAQLSRQDRTVAIFATTERQIIRLGLSLRASGLNDAEVAHQCMIVHPASDRAAEFERVSVDQAQALLAASPSRFANRD